MYSARKAKNYNQSSRPKQSFALLHFVYALSEYYQECCCLTVAPAYGVSVAALRFLQCGRHEAGTLEPVHWSLGHYAARVLNGRRPLVNEDGNQTGALCA
jgi:dTDP-L-rhamnose 4-epimerase